MSTPYQQLGQRTRLPSQTTIKLQNLEEWWQSHREPKTRKNPKYLRTWYDLLAGGYILWYVWVPAYMNNMRTSACERSILRRLRVFRGCSWLSEKAVRKEDLSQNVCTLQAFLGCASWIRCFCRVLGCLLSLFWLVVCFWCAFFDRELLMRLGVLFVFVECTFWLCKVPQDLQKHLYTGRYWKCVSLPTTNHYKGPETKSFDQPSS